jgi:hypothetical protein
VRGTSRPLCRAGERTARIAVEGCVHALLGWDGHALFAIIFLSCGRAGVSRPGIRGCRPADSRKE